MLKKRKPPHKTLHLAMDAELEGNLDRIVAHMKSHPLLGNLQVKLGREKAARFAVARCVEMLEITGG